MSMDGISTIRIGAQPLNEQRDGSHWARAGHIELGITRLTGGAFFATVEDDGEPIAAGEGDTPHDAAQAATAEIMERLGALALILGVDISTLGLDGEAVA